LTYLSFGRNFNREVEVGILPDTVTQLSFGENFNQALTEEVLPKSLTRLKLLSK
jgi:hypothetical protein